MTITRTPIHDDDGTGTTGTIIDNAWKQEFYNQIDAFVGTLVPTYGTWTGVDASGAGLTFLASGGNWAKWGRLVYVQIQLAYPSTANGSSGIISGLPAGTGFSASAHSGLYQSYGGPAVRGWISAGDNKLQILNASTGAPMTNAQLSNGNFVLSGLFLAGS